MTYNTQLVIALGALLAVAVGPAAVAQTTPPKQPVQAQQLGQPQPPTEQMNTEQRLENRQQMQRTGMQQAMNQQWQQMANGSGKVSKNDYDRYWKQQFRMADTNHDGKLSRQECVAAVQKANGANFSQVKFNQMWNEASHHGYITPSEDLAWHDMQFSKATRGKTELTKTEFRHAIDSRNQSLASL